MSKKIICISDISVGFGTPQIQNLVTSIGRYFKLDKKDLIVYEPDQDERPVIKRPELGIQVNRIYSRKSKYSFIGALRYFFELVKVINKEKPSILVLTSPKLLIILQLLNYKPKYMICYMLETVPFILSRLPPFLYDMYVIAIRKVVKDVNLFIFPEHNRAINDIELLSIKKSQSRLVFNVPKGEPLSIDDCLKSREKKIIYTGSISEDSSYINYLFDYPLPLSTHLFGFK